MNIRCPNCGAVFPAAANQQGASECPLCLHVFDPGGANTVSVASPLDQLSNAGAEPQRAPDDDFESFGPTGGFDTSVLGSQNTNPFAMGPAAGGDLFSANTSVLAPSAALSPTDPFAAGDGGGGDVDFGALLGQIDDSAGSAATESNRSGRDSLFGGHDDDAEDSLFLATANTSGAMFDSAHDEDEDEADHRDAMPQRFEPAEAPKTKKEAGPAPMPTGRRVAILLLVVLALGIGLDYAGMPHFGLAGLFGPSEEDIAKAAKPNIATNLLVPTILKDTVETYVLEISRLEQVVAANPGDPLMQRTHLERLLDLYERFPDEFAAEPRYKLEIEKYQRLVSPFPGRFEVLDLITQGRLDAVDARLEALVGSETATADDLAVAAMVRMEQWVIRLRKRALNSPGLISRSDVDPLRADGSQDAGLKQARSWLDRARKTAEKQPNLLKFDFYAARLRDQMGGFEDNAKALTALLDTAPEHNELRLLLASAQLETNHLGQTASLLKEATGRAETQKRVREMVEAWRIEARLAARRGRKPDLIVALQGVLKLRPGDELTRVRLARLLLEEKRAAESQAVLVEGKKRGMSSIAFEVALVEYWLWAHRDEDALAEIVEATKRFPDSVDLLFLRGQVEDQQQHHATARDYFAKVIAREPRHMRAILRLAELQAKAGRHDDALITLQSARERLGDMPAVLEPMARELTVLRRHKESRELYGILLQKQPSNREFLLSAARLDLQAGEVDSALRYLRILREDGALDREGAMQMALALASKGKPAEAAQTLMPFAEKEPTNMHLNTMTGKYLLDSDDIDRAVTFLKRAYTVAHRQGGDPETLFQYGRLAFRRGEVEEGSNRIQLAIKSDPRAHHYRYHLALFLLKVDPDKHEKSRAVAVDQLRYLILHADRFASSGNHMEYLDDVHRQLANHYVNEQQFNKAIPHLRKTLEMKPDDVDTRVNLGTALFQVNHPDAEAVLRQVMKQRPNNAMAALYLGLISLSKNQSSEALLWLTRAARSPDPAVVEAHYQLALIHRDRKQVPQAIRYLQVFLERAPAKHPFRQDAKSLMQFLRGG